MSTRIRQKKIDGGNMRARIYPLLTRCVETGVEYGWGRAHKHTDKPDQMAIMNAIEDAVLSELCEWFHWEDDF